MNRKAMLGVLEATGLLRLMQYPYHQAGRHVFVLAYHRVDTRESDVSKKLYDLVSALPEQFEQQMRLIRDCYNPVSAADVVEALNGRKTLPAHAVLVTVDDGYADFAQTIFPIASRYAIKPVLFVPTRFIGGGIFWWDRLHLAMNTARFDEVKTPLGLLSLRTPIEKQHAFSMLANYVRMHEDFNKARIEIESLCQQVAPQDSPPESHVLDWPTLRELSTAGATIAAHTHSHPILTHISHDEVRAEIRKSQEIIRKEIGSTLPIFAYPDGRGHAVNAEIARIAKEEGIQIAFTMENRMGNLATDDPLLFPRLIPYVEQSAPRFHLSLTSFNAMRKAA